MKSSQFRLFVQFNLSCFSFQRHKLCRNVNAFQNHINKRMKEYDIPFFCIFTPNFIQGMNDSSLSCPYFTLMKPRATIKLIYAWTLVIMFMSTVVLKGFHYHDTSYNGKAKVSANHEVSVKQICYVCDYFMHVSTIVKPTVFMAIIAVSWVVKIVFTEQTVYRTVASINSHSPPIVG